jgi:general secretion pathway protein H
MIRARGFTLLELLVVVAVVAILASTVQLVGLSSDPQARLQSEAEPLLRVLRQQCRQARLVNSDRAVGLLQTGWYALERGSDGEWRADPRGGLMRPRELAPDVRWELVADGRDIALPAVPEAPPEAHLRCRPGGWVSPWRLTMEHAEGGRIRIRGQGRAEFDVDVLD